MSDIATTFSTTDWIRLPLVYAHLLLCAFAITQVLRTDLAIFRGRFTPEELERVARGVAYLLAALWITGLSIVWLDTRLDPAALADKPKLLFKLLCVLVLTANGIVLHVFSFPLVAGRGRLALPASLLLTLSGALSTGHWLLAVFIGMNESLGRWSLQALLLGYVLFVLSTSLAAVACTPLIRQRLLCWRVRRAAAACGRRAAPAPTPALALPATMMPALAIPSESPSREPSYVPSDELRIDFIHL